MASVLAPRRGGYAPEIVELHVPVAADTWARRAATCVLVEERLDDLLPELVRVVEDVVRDAEVGSDRSRIRNVGR